MRASSRPRRIEAGSALRDRRSPIGVTLEQGDPCIKPIEQGEEGTVDVGREEGARRRRRFSRIGEPSLRYPHTSEGGRADQGE